MVNWWFGSLDSSPPPSRPVVLQELSQFVIPVWNLPLPLSHRLEKCQTTPLVSFGKTPNETIGFVGFLQQCSTFQEGFLICGVCPEINEVNRYGYPPWIGIRLSPDVHQGHIMSYSQVVSIPIVSISQDRAPQNPTVFIMIFHIWHLFDETIHHFTTLRTYFAVWIHGIHGEITFSPWGPPQWRRLRRSGIDWFQSPPSDALRSPRGYPKSSSHGWHLSIVEHRWALKPMVT